MHVDLSFDTAGVDSVMAVNAATALGVEGGPVNDDQIECVTLMTMY